MVFTTAAALSQVLIYVIYRIDLVPFESGEEPLSSEVA